MIMAVFPACPTFYKDYLYLLRCTQAMANPMMKRCTQAVKLSSNYDETSPGYLYSQKLMRYSLSSSCLSKLLEITFRQLETV